MHLIIYSTLTQTKLLVLLLAIILFSSCTRHAFSPVNEGREYGNPKTPPFISHVPQNNRKVLDRTDHHSYFQKILCFNYACRRIVGRQKVSGIVSLRHFEKQVRKNARKGLYKNIKPSPQLSPTDTVHIDKKPEPVVVKETTNTVTEPLLKPDSLITLHDFLFETSKFTLKADQFSELDHLASYILSHPTLEVHVSGHTDNIGKERDNVVLSAKRAEAVAKYLIEKGVLKKLISFDGLGSSKPLMSNKTEEGRSKNRRVEILIHNPANK